MVNINTKPIKAQTVAYNTEHAAESRMDTTYPRTVRPPRK
jgi:hypothetical protein